MNNLNPTPGWDAVPQLETSTQAIGGPGGPMNSQAQALLNRTEKLAADDATNLAAAKSYADTKDAATLASAKSYADAGDAFTLASAKTYADSGDSATLASAKSYADTKSAAATPADGSVTDAKISSTDTVLDAIVSKLLFVAAGVGAVYRSLRDKLRDTVSVKDFGAKGDGVTDDSAAFQAALTYCASFGGDGVELIIPSGNYLLNSAISFNGNKQLSVAGHGSPKLIFKDATATPAVSITSTAPIRVFGVRLIVPPYASGVRTGIKISAGQDRSIYLRDVEVWRDSTAGANGIVGFDLINPSLSRVEHCHFNGFPGTPYAAVGSGGIAFRMTATNQISTDSVFDGCTANGVEYAFRTIAPLGGSGGAYLEGITWVNCTAVSVQHGVFASGDSTTTYRSVLYRWIGGHVNAQTYCMHFQGLNQIHVSDAVLYLDRNGTPQTPILFEKCYDANALGNTVASIDQTGGGGTSSGTGIVFDATCSLGTARNNTLDGILSPAAGVWGQSGSNRILVSHNTVKGTSTTAVLLQGTNSVDQGGNILF